MSRHPASSDVARGPLTSARSVRTIRAAMRSCHLTFAAAGRHPLFPGEAARRAAVRALGRVAGAWIVLFAVVDDHVHVVLSCEEERVGRLARAILLALRPLASAEIEPAHVRPVRDRRHLECLVGYVLSQPQHHGLSEHAALTTGSCYPDLVGARVVPGMAMPILRALPRFRLRDACRHVGLPEVELRPASLDVVRAAGAARLVEAVGNALAVGPPLAGNVPAVVEARAAAVQLAAAAGLHLAEVAHALGVGPDAARKVGARPSDERIHRAARVRLALEAAIAAAPRSADRPPAP